MGNVYCFEGDLIVDAAPLFGGWVWCGVMD